MVSLNATCNKKLSTWNCLQSNYIFLSYDFHRKHLLSPKHHYPIRLYNGYVVCSMWDINLVSVYNAADISFITTYIRVSQFLDFKVQLWCSFRLNFALERDTDMSVSVHAEILTCQYQCMQTATNVAACFMKERQIFNIDTGNAACALLEPLLRRTSAM
jgi:hypothetical protein